MGLDLPRPQGAFYLFPDFSPFSGPLRRKGLDTSPKLCQYLLDELLIATLPSSDFYCPEDWLACRVASVDYDGADVLERPHREFLGTWSMLL